jgi:uncharacterized delta-60 repeat protein
MGQWVAQRGFVLITLALSLWSGPVRLMHDVGNAVARYNADGTPDTSFNASGLVAVDAPQQMYANGLVIQADERLVVAGAASNVTAGSVGFGLARYNPDGGLDPTFGAGGTVSTRVGERDAEAHAVAVLPDGRLVVAGTAFGPGGLGDQFAVARFNADGTLDASFGVGGLATTAVGAGSAEGRALAIQPDGKLLVVGSAFFNGPTEDDFGVVRFERDGSLDTSFGSGGVVTTDFSPIEPGPGATFDRANAVALQQDGKIVVVGSTGRESTDFALARYNPDGTLDPTFGSSGRALGSAGQHSEAYAVAQSADGRLVVAGSGASASDGNGDSAFVLARYEPDGTRDMTFGSNGSVTTSFEGGGSGARSVLIQPDGAILVGGSGYGPITTNDVPIGGFAVVRYNADGSLDTRFGNAGRMLTSVADVGGIANALGLLPDGRIIAAGMATFRTTQPR